MDEATRAILLMWLGYLNLGASILVRVWQLSGRKEVG